jgi:hypothetical protein
VTKLRFNITMTRDGYVAGPNQSSENPLGEEGEHLHDWLSKLKIFRAIHRDTSGGETATNDDVLREAFKTLGTSPQQFRGVIEGINDRKQPPTLEELATVAIFMASNRASAMTGNIVNLSRGSIAN